jgi:tRNA modification GTPase
LGGGLRDVVDALSEALLALRARITAHIDFSDEGDVREEDMADLRKGLASILNEIDGLLLRARRAERVREGFRVALCGLPNAGKSSLLNAMAGRDVAIVHPTPGTTRDRLDVALDLDGYPVVLYDTAGLRETSDQVEAIGVERTRQAAQEADIAIWLAPLDEPAAPPPDWAVSSWIVLTSKDDHGIETGSVSVLRNDGLEAIKAAIHAAIQRFGADNEPVVVARERQRMLLEKAQLACGRALVVSEIELVDAELQLAHGALAELVGRVGIENVLDSLFSRFCIGK